MRIWKKDTHMIVTPRIRAMADAMPAICCVNAASRMYISSTAVAPL